MTELFAETYALAYDKLYAAKDYDAECDLIETAFRRYAAFPVRRVLDLGCGTGGHSLRLSDRGYAVTGVDASHAMLGRARSNSRGSAGARFIAGDIRTVSIGSLFDAALLMFAVLGYQLENRHVLATLVNVRSHLRPGGLLLGDAWYGPGVLSEPPAERVTRASGVVRHSSGELDAQRQVCTVHFRVSGDVGDTYEVHPVRFFFARELELYLELAGFDLLALSPFGTLDTAPDQTTRNVTFLARATSRPSAPVPAVLIESRSGFEVDVGELAPVVVAGPRA